MDIEYFIQLISNYTEVKKVNLHLHLLEDLGLDSFQMMEIVAEIEEQGYYLDFNKMKKIDTVEDLYHAFVQIPQNPSVE